jgi:hypothetical protein
MNDLLAIRDLRISFHLHDALIEAVRGISFTVPLAARWRWWVSPDPARPSSARQ